MREIRDFFEIDGDKLEYHLITPRKSRDTTLVFLHEGLGCVAMWKDFPRRVAEATGYPTLAYSRAGYGGSTPCQRPKLAQLSEIESGYRWTAFDPVNHVSVFHVTGQANSMN